MDKSLDLGVDYGSTDALADVLTDDLADDRCQTQMFLFVVLCDPHAREILLSFPTACDACDARCCSLPAATAVLLLCCTSATGGVM